MTNGASRGIAAALLALAAATLTACTSSGNGSGSTLGASSLATSPVVTDTVPVSPSSETTSAASSTSAAPSTSRAASSSPAPQPSHSTSCAAASLRTDVLSGGAVAGEEIALITFTNISKSTCTISGFPGVTLRLNGKQVGTPARASTHAPKLVTLKPNAQAESQISDFSSCQAPVSDAVRITPPGSPDFVDKPLEMRACTLVVDPVSLSQ